MKDLKGAERIFKLTKYPGNTELHHQLSPVYLAPPYLETFCTVNKSSCLKPGIVVLVLW